MPRSFLNESFDVSLFLNCLRPGIDAVVKASPTLPAVAIGDDVDIYTLDKDRLLGEFFTVALQERVDLRVADKGPYHSHVDVYEGSAFLYRLDTYSAFPDYKRFSVRPEAFPYLVGRSISSKKNREHTYPVLPKMEDAFIRYLEFCEFYWFGPEKPHHLNWIMQNLTDDELSALYSLAHSKVEVFSGDHGPGTRQRSGTLAIVNRWMMKFRFMKRFLPERVVWALRKFTT